MMGGRGGITFGGNTGSDLAGDFEKWREKAWRGVSFDSTNCENLPLGSLKTFHLDLWISFVFWRASIIVLAGAWPPQYDGCCVRYARFSLELELELDVDGRR